METETENQITHAHDKFVRTAMADLRVARDFFAVHLPEDLRRVVDLKTLELQPRSHIDDVRKETTVDILYKATMDGHEAFLYLLLEHQSKPDPLMAFRMHRYTCNVISHYLDTTKKKSLPLIYPMVVYHGERRYPYSTDIKDIIEAPKEFVERYFLKPFHLIDLGQIEDKELKQHAWAGAMEFALKHIGGRQYISLVLQYILERGEMRDREAFFGLINTEISTEVGGNVMSLAEQLRAEGIDKGKIEGRIETAQMLLADNAEPVWVAKVTKLPLATIKEIQEKTNAK